MKRKYFLVIHQNNGPKTSLQSALPTPRWLETKYRYHDERRHHQSPYFMYSKMFGIEKWRMRFEFLFGIIHLPKTHLVEKPGRFSRCPRHEFRQFLFLDKRIPKIVCFWVLFF